MCCSSPNPNQSSQSNPFVLGEDEGVSVQARTRISGISGLGWGTTAWFRGSSVTEYVAIGWLEVV